MRNGYDCLEELGQHPLWPVLIMGDTCNIQSKTGLNSLELSRQLNQAKLKQTKNWNLTNRWNIKCHCFDAAIISPRHDHHSGFVSTGTSSRNWKQKTYWMVFRLTIDHCELLPNIIRVSPGKNSRKKCIIKNPVWARRQRWKIVNKLKSKTNSFVRFAIRKLRRKNSSQKELRLQRKHSEQLSVLIGHWHAERANHC